ncbi:putative Zinc phosphodiesterase ELAC protein 2 [Blattamonas nauphoetae]|uniref:ribonuclease Z n=1 Tax=Blattamonas nauphoetae TaxID=2049346 RepID=A0ABQ9X5H7_9EUKA|nr:putative Zinc phosphodiesterase ELAC protein 2 [Blattamonas nauphoetae]
MYKSYFLQINAVHSSDSSPSVLVKINDIKLIFNVGEGLQRFCNSHSLAPSSISSLFLTTLQPRSMGGFPGLILSLEQAGNSTYTVTGPSGFSAYMVGIEHSIDRNMDTIGLTELPDTDISAQHPQCFPGVTVYPVSLRPQEDPSIILYPQLSSDNPSPLMQSSDIESALNTFFAEWHSDNEPDSFLERLGPSSHIKQIRRNPVSSSIIQSFLTQATQLHSLKESGSLTTLSIKPVSSDKTPVPRQAICYFIDPAPKPGPFSVKRVQAMGVTDKRMYGTLQKGNPVTLPDGRVIQPEDVMDPAQPISAVLVVDCPHESFIPSLHSTFDLSNPTSFLSERFQADPLRQSLEMEYVIVHFTPTSVFLSPQYQQWMWSLSTSSQTAKCSVQHVVLNSLSPDIASTHTQCGLHNTLSLVDPVVYPPLFTDEEEDLQPGSDLMCVPTGLEEAGLEIRRHSQTGVYLLSPSPLSPESFGTDTSFDLSVASNVAILGQPNMSISLKPQTVAEHQQSRKKGRAEFLREIQKGSSGTSVPLPQPDVLSKMDLFLLNLGGHQIAVNTMEADQHSLSDPLRSHRMNKPMLKYLHDQQILLPDTESSLNEQFHLRHQHRQEERTDELARLVVFGSCAAVPGKYRNVESLLIDLSSSNLLKQIQSPSFPPPNLTPPFSLLLDCGENTVGQLGRYYSGLFSNHQRALALCPDQPPFPHTSSQHIHLRQSARQTFVDQMISSVSTVFLSHSHADHINGVWPFVAHRHSTTPSIPLTVIGPWKVFMWLQFLNQLWPAPLQFVWMMPLAPHLPLSPQPPQLTPETLTDFVQSLNHPYVYTRPANQNDPVTGAHIPSFVNTTALQAGLPPISVPHPATLAPPSFLSPPKIPFPKPDAFLPTILHTVMPNHSIFRLTFPFTDHLCRGSVGIVADFVIPCQSSSFVFRISYSGDTAVTPYFNSEALFSTVLVHEATQCDANVIAAAERLHSTLSQALVEVGEVCRPKLLLLNHFSQRIPKSIPFATLLDGAAKLKEKKRYESGTIDIDLAEDIIVKHLQRKEQQSESLFNLKTNTRDTSTDDPLSDWGDEEGQDDTSDSESNGGQPESMLVDDPSSQDLHSAVLLGREVDVSLGTDFETVLIGPCSDRVAGLNLASIQFGGHCHSFSELVDVQALLRNNDTIKKKKGDDEGSDAVDDTTTRRKEKKA